MSRDFPNKSSERIWFIHLRYRNKKGEVENNGGLTIAYRKGHNEGQLEVAIARCRYNDNFNKRIGRSIAVGNLNWNNCWVVACPTDANPHNIALEYVRRKIVGNLTASQNSTVH